MGTEYKDQNEKQKHSKIYDNSVIFVFDSHQSRSYLQGPGHVDYEYCTW